MLDLDPIIVPRPFLQVFCVQLVSMLGYHVLFQDVDVIWYKDPLADFSWMDKTSIEVDVYMQHDGNHGEYYAPYSGNTGFYYVRNTQRTQVNTTTKYCRNLRLLPPSQSHEQSSQTIFCPVFSQFTLGFWRLNHCYKSSPSAILVSHE
jgi:Nucleotide-diphospho-sugar transferase